VRLRVLRSNPRALRLYERLGFRRDEQIPAARGATHRQMVRHPRRASRDRRATVPRGWAGRWAGTA
jgi:ribosomal protein S18 acetylase RimI-like enzyme